MKRIILYGILGRKYGKHWLLDVRTPAEALRAIDANRSGFLDEVRELAAKGVRYVCKIGDEHVRDARRLAQPFGDVEPFRFAPAVSGAGLEAALIAGGVGLMFAAETVATFLTGLEIFGVIAASSVAMFGFGMVLSGASSLLAPKPKPVEAPSPVERKASYYFSGPVNVTTQGGCVPVCYGRMRVGSVVISVGIETSDIV